MPGSSRLPVFGVVLLALAVVPTFCRLQRQNRLGVTPQDDPVEDAEDPDAKTTVEEYVSDRKWPVDGNYDGYEREVRGGEYDNATKKELAEKRGHSDHEYHKDYVAHQMPNATAHKHKATEPKEPAVSMGNPWIIGLIALLVAIVIGLIRVCAFPT